MRYLGTNFSLVLGAWRLRLVLALEDAVDDDHGAADAPVKRRPYDRRVPHVVRIDPHAAANRRN